MNPDCFLIRLKNHELSENLTKECLLSADLHGWKINLYDGIIGTSLTSKDWKNINVEPLASYYNMSKPGVQGCFMSHFNLWERCISLNKEIIILEHDALIHSSWDKNLEGREELTKLTMFRQKKGIRDDPRTGVWTTGLIAYLINPTQARSAVNFCRNIGGLPADVVMGSAVVKYRHLDYLYVSMNDKMNDKSKSTTNFL